MSHIFDALQRSESELSGTEASSFSLATELLQAAEEKMRVAVAKEPIAKEPAVIRSEPDRSSVDQDAYFPVDLQQFPSLKVTVPAGSRLVSIEKEESLGAEKFRFLAVRLRHIRQTRPLKKILITSTIPEEGKSTVAANLACTLGRRKPQKTLLLEGDLRRPNIAAQFGLDKLPGLCDWLSGETPTISIYRLENLGVWLLPAGTAPQNPLELMQAGKLSSLMDQLEAWFDWIVIDSPPVLPLADASLWSKVADGILLVTRKGVTEKQQLQHGLEALDKSKLLGALMNSSTDVAHSDYYQRYGSPTVDQSKK
jgi:capsular exopolysaccharide synthesis family protein